MERGDHTFCPVSMFRVGCSTFSFTPSKQKGLGLCLAPHQCQELCCCLFFVFVAQHAAVSTRILGVSLGRILQLDCCWVGCLDVNVGVVTATKSRHSYKAASVLCVGPKPSTRAAEARPKPEDVKTPPPTSPCSK